LVQKSAFTGSRTTLLQPTRQATLKLFSWILRAGILPAWEQRTSEVLEQWISWCQRANAALWIAVPKSAPESSLPRAGEEPAGWGRVSRQMAGRVAKARDRHWTSWLSSQGRSRLLEVREASNGFSRNSAFDKSCPDRKVACSMATSR
jgi:hypothetical protein